MSAARPATWNAPRGAAVALVSLYDLENNAVRQLAAALRRQGRRVVEVYLKDWRNNRIEAPSEEELLLLEQLLRREGVGLVGLSLRASAYEGLARQVAERIHALGLPVVLGGWHATVRPEACMAFADVVCLGEADISFPAFVDAWFQGKGDYGSVAEQPGFMLRAPSGEIRRNAPPPLIELDRVPWRDYTSPDKWCIEDGRIVQGDPMAEDPLYQVMCSVGCIQKCSFCHNSFETEAVGPRLRVRSVSSVLDELNARRAANPRIRRVRFDDEIFGLRRSWLREFAERYPKEVGLPFDVLTEPTVVGEEYADLLKAAGAQVVHMGLQSDERVNRETLERRADRKTTLNAIELLTERGLYMRYLVMVDVPGTRQEDQDSLFKVIAELPRPYDLYLFSLTWFPGSKMVEDMLARGDLTPEQVEGQATKTFYQYRVDLGWPREDIDRWWLSMLVLQSSGVVPRRVLAKVVDRRLLQSNPAPAVLAAQAAGLAKTAQVAARMVRSGELTPTLVRRWWNPRRLITM